MGSRCYWVADAEIGRWFNPQCMGGAVYGERGCTCPSRKSSLSDRVSELERIVEDLKRSIQPSQQEPRS